MDKPTDRIEFETMLLGRHLTRPRRGAGHLDASAYALLSRLRIDGPMSVGELSEAFGLDTSTISRQSTAMLNSGLVERIPDPAGGMARKFRITVEGSERLAAERAFNIDGLDLVMADWAPGDVAAFAAMLERFNLDIERRAGRPWPRES